MRGTVRQTIEKHGGKVTRESEPQKRKLAYVIKGIRNGIYLIIRFTTEKRDQLKEISRDIILSKEVIRHMVVTAQELPKEKEKPKTDLDKIIEQDQDHKNLIEEITRKKDSDLGKTEAGKAKPGKPETEDKAEAKVEKKATTEETSAEPTKKDEAESAEETVEETEKVTAATEEKAEKQEKEKPALEAEEKPVKKSIKSSAKKDKLKFEDLDKKLDDILKDDLI